jgi:hypothetical protein
MEKSQQISKKLYPAMRELGSELSGKLRDIAHETRYMTDETKRFYSEKHKTWITRILS